MEKLKEFLNYSFTFSKDVAIDVKHILIIIITLIITSIVLRLLRKLITRKLPEQDKIKFVYTHYHIQQMVYLCDYFINDLS